MKIFTLATAFLIPINITLAEGVDQQGDVGQNVNSPEAGQYYNPVQGLPDTNSPVNNVSDNLQNPGNLSSESLNPTGIEQVNNPNYSGANIDQQQSNQGYYNVNQIGSDNVTSSLALTPDSRGESYQPVESQIAGNLVRALNWEQTDSGFTQSYGDAFNARREMATYGLAASGINNVETLPQNWYKSGPESIELYEKAKEGYLNNPEAEKLAANGFYKSLFENGEHSQNTLKVPGLESKPLQNYTEADKVSALNYFSHQKIPMESAEPSNSSRYVNAINWLLAADGLAGIGEAALGGFAEREALGTSLKANDYAGEQIPNASSSSNLRIGDIERDLQQPQNLNISIPKIFNSSQAGERIFLMKPSSEQLFSAGNLKGDPQIIQTVNSLNNENTYLFFTDTYKNQPRLNIIGHGVPNTESNSSLFAIKNGETTRQPFDVAYDIYNLPGNVPYNNIRCISCHSAEGGINSFAQKLADYTGTPVKGYHGTVTATGYINNEHPIIIKDFIDNLIYRGNPGEINYQPQKFFPIWRPYL